MSRRYRLPMPARVRPLLVAASALVAIVTTGVLAVTAAQAGTAPVPASTDFPTTPPPSSAPSSPSAPGDLTASAVTAGSVTLTWTPSSPGCCAIAGYTLTYQQVPNDVIWQTDVGDVTTVRVTTNIQAASQYQFRVAARDTSGHLSPSSNGVTVVTPASDTASDTVPPSTPADLAASAVTAMSATLTWSPSTDNVGVVGYRVYRYDGLGVSTLLATAAGTTYQVALSGALNEFYVRAVDAAGNVSVATNLLSVNRASPSAPPTPSAPATCRVAYTTMAQWTGGFVAGVTVTNLGATPVAGWRLTFTFGGDQRVTAAWNTSASQSGTAVALTNVDWNGAIASGSSVSVGLQGTWSASNAPPGGFALNGAPCVAG